MGLVRQGASTSDNNRFLRLWYEVGINKIGFNINSLEESINSGYKYFPYNKGGGFKKWHGNFEYVINYANDGYELKKYQSTLNQGWTARLKSREYYFKESISWSKISSGSFSVRLYPKGFIFDVAGCCYFPNQSNYYYFLALLNSQISKTILALLSPTMNYEIEHIKKIPLVLSNEFDANIVLYAISLSKTDWDSRETSWDFETNPLVAQQAESLQSAYSLWQKQVTEDFYQLHANEEELNRIFIEIYGLQDELTPEVSLRDITILQDELKADDLDAIEEAFRLGKQPELPIQRDVVIQQLISYLIGIMMGRYRLDKLSLHIAHPNPSEEELASYRVGNAAIPFTMQIDEDAILPLMGSECAFSDDAVKRVQDLVHKLWGDKSQVENMNFINDCLGMELEKWMTEKFWAEHISGRMYKKKPIYWLFCSNPASPQRSAFRVLVYMHRMNEFTVQNILLKYLHPHLAYLKLQYEDLSKRQVDLSRDEARQFETLQKQISELNEYEEQLKIVANQQISFDLDDGVSVNYAKFEGVVAKI